MQKSSYESDRGIPASVWTPLHPFTRSSLVKKIPTCTHNTHI